MGGWALTHCYFAFGVHFRSERPIPDLAEAEDAPPGAVAIRWAAIPKDLAAATYRDRVLQVAGPKVQITVEGVARYLMSDGEAVTVDPASGASERDVRAYLLGTALGLLCHQRGFLPLHANAVVFDGRAVAFAGRSGIGKSTLAAQFHRMGQPLLSDDVCAVSFPDLGPPLAWAGVPRIRLWKDMSEALGRDVDGLEPVADNIDKYCWPHQMLTPQEGMPLQAVYVLADAGAESKDAIERLSGWQALEAVMEQTFRREFLNLIGAHQERFARGLALLARTPIYRVPWRRDIGAIAEDAGRLQAHIRSNIAELAAAS